MKTAVVGEDPDGAVTYKPLAVALLGHYGAVPRACRPYRAKTKGKVERPSATSARLLPGPQLPRPRRPQPPVRALAHDARQPRTHATTGRVVDEAFADERPHLATLPALPYSAPLSVERRISRDGMVSVSGNLYSVPDATRRRVVEVQNHPGQVASSRTAR